MKMNFLRLFSKKIVYESLIKKYFSLKNSLHCIINNQSIKKF